MTPLLLILNPNPPSRRTTQLVIVGDPDQLPPVGPGAPLRAAIDAGLLPLVDLRQARGGAPQCLARALFALLGRRQG
jgi:ATP-dependent exoDNAse (exonuclease V) alpha subunit